MKYAVVKTGGKQYKISEGDILEIERLSADDKEKITLDDVLLYTADGAVRVGTPTVTGITIRASILGQTKGKKIRVAKFKAKARYRRVAGHRQSLTKIKIDSIEESGGSKKDRSEEKATRTVKKETK